MKAIALVDIPVRDDFFPFTLTRRVADIRIGILTIREKWTRLFGFEVASADTGSDCTEIPANLLPDESLAAAIRGGDPSVTAACISRACFVRDATDIVVKNENAIRTDFEQLTKGRQSAPIPLSVQSIGPEHIFIEEGAQLDCCLLNAAAGPVYIGKDAIIMEGSTIRGPFSLGEGAVVKMGSRIYGATSIGPHCTVGGEIKNSVIFGYSNKAHEGYLGDSVIGEFCNLGAGTSNSNIKNNAGNNRAWNDQKQAFFPEALKSGVLMGDYSRTAIQTAFNTGTVVGVSCNIFGVGLTPKWIPSFSWGYSPIADYHFNKAIEHIANWKKLKHQLLTDEETGTLKKIFDQKNKPS